MYWYFRWLWICLYTYIYSFFQMINIMFRFYLLVTRICQRNHPFFIKYLIVFYITYWGQKMTRWWIHIFSLSFKSIKRVNNRCKELIYNVQGKLHLVSCVLAFQCSFQKCQIKNSNKQFEEISPNKLSLV